MKRTAILALALALTLATQAQDGLNQPYSQYGLGMSHLPYNMPTAASLGGSVITLAGNNIVNPFNPASYGSIEKESFVFDMGFGFDMVGLRDATTNLHDGDGNLSHIAVAFPLARWWKTALAIMPMSELNYSTTREESLPNVPQGTVRTIYGGSGSVSRVMWGHAFNLVPNRLSIGANLNYYYGAISREIQYLFSSPDTTPQYTNVIRQRVTLVNNFSLDFGLQYQQPLGQHHRLDIGLTLATPRAMGVTDNAMVRTFMVQNSLLYYRDTIFPGPGEESEYRSTMTLPLQAGIGVALQRNDLWRVAFDATYAAWSGAKYEDAYQLFGATAAVYDNHLRCNLGLQLLGDPASSHYARRITYNAGMSYEMGKLRLSMPGSADVQVLNQWGLGLGAQLPMRKGKSLLHLSASFTSMGTPEVLRQNCLTLGLGVSSCESWFVKRKYN